MRYLNIQQVEQAMRAFAKLEIIMISKEDKWLRVCNFSQRNNMRIYEIANGEGDYVFVYIDGNSALIRGFAYKSEISPYANENDYELVERIYKNCPLKIFNQMKDEEKYDTSFALWNTLGDKNWDINYIDEDDGGLTELMKYIFENPKQLSEWAEDYHEIEFDENILTEIWNNTPINAEIVQKINPERDLHEALVELKETFKEFKKYV